MAPGGQVLATNGSGTLGWASGLAPNGAAAGDLSGNFPNPSIATVGASTAANIHNAEVLANSATNVNTASTIVKRDGSGNFTAGTITANLTGTASTATSAGSFTGSLAGDVTGTQGATVVSNVGGVTAANVASGANLANAATTENTASTIIKRDASGNFAAGIITANLTGTASIATAAGSFTGALVGDVTGTQDATVVAKVGTSSASNIQSAELAANAASSANSALAIVRRDSNGGFSSGLINSTTPNATSLGLIVKGSASQSANLQEWQDNSGAVLSAINSSGYLKLKDSDGTDNYVSLRASPTMASNLTYTLPGTVSAGAYLTTDGSGNMSWSAPGSFTGSLSGDVTGTQGATVVANVGGLTAANVAAGAGLANAATNLNTASTIVKRDGSGNFSAGTVTANLTGNVTGNLTGNVSGTAANVTGTVAVANGGTGATTLTANNVLIGNGISAPLTVAPGTSGNVLMSTGTTWASSTPITNWDAPGAIGATTPSSAAFTTLTASGNVGIGTTNPAVTLDLRSRTDALALPSGTSAQQPASPVAGWIRYNSTNNNIEYYNGSIWTAASNAVDPAGMVGSFPMGTCPTGWLEANGAAVSRTTYASLFTALSTMYGAGDGSTTFNLPDYRGYFLRGWSHGSGADPDAATRTNRGDGTSGDSVGTKQTDAFASHYHVSGFAGVNNTAAFGVSTAPGGNLNTQNGTSSSNHDNSSSVGANETRPKNVNVIYCVSTATIAAATTANTGSGSANYIPLWTSTTALGNSPIAVSGSNVGIGTTAPGSPLTVAGVIQSTSGGVKFPDGSVQTTSAGPATQNNVTSSRSLSTVYQNTTGKPMFVSVSDQAGVNYHHLGGYSDASSNPSTLVSWCYADGNGCAISFWVMPNGYYKVAQDTGGDSVRSWIEWY